MEGWMVLMRLWAHSRVRNLGLSGKLERTWMSLSEKSKLSWGCDSISLAMISRVGDGEDGLHQLLLGSLSRVSCGLFRNIDMSSFNSKCSIHSFQ